MLFDKKERPLGQNWFILRDSAAEQSTSSAPLAKYRAVPIWVAIKERWTVTIRANRKYARECREEITYRTSDGFFPNTWLTSQLPSVSWQTSFWFSFQKVKQLSLSHHFCLGLFQFHPVMWKLNVEFSIKFWLKGLFVLNTKNSLKESLLNLILVKLNIVCGAFHLVKNLGFEDLIKP